MTLDHEIWKTLMAAYKTPYDASIPLKQLRSSTNIEVIDSIFTELWDELHHQGDVGLASYLSVPQLIFIYIEKKSLDYNFIGLCVCIELCRIEDRNPKLPEEYRDYYFNALKTFETYLLQHFKEIKNVESIRLSLAFFAIMKEQHSLAKAIQNLDEDVLEEFLGMY